jgi:hypothetical protein
MVLGGTFILGHPLERNMGNTLTLMDVRSNISIKLLPGVKHFYEAGIKVVQIPRSG